MPIQNSACVKFKDLAYCLILLVGKRQENQYGICFDNRSNQSLGFSRMVKYKQSKLQWRCRIKVSVVYQSRNGNTKAVAEELAKLLNVKAIEVADSFEEDADVILLGGGTYMHSMDKSLVWFIEELSSGKIKKIIPFATAGVEDSVIGGITRAACANGIEVSKQHLLIKCI